MEEAALRAIGGGEVGLESMEALNELSRDKIDILLTDQTLQRRFREWARRNHPDHGGDTGTFQSVKSGVDSLLNKMRERREELQAQMFERLREQYRDRSAKQLAMIEKAQQMRSKRMLMRWLELSQVWKTVKEGNGKSPWDDKQTILSILQRRGSLIGKVSEAHRRDVDLIRAAVAENGMCLRYADSTLRKDMPFVRMAVEENGKALMFADEQLQADDDLLWRALQSSEPDVRFSPEYFLREDSSPLRHLKTLSCSVMRVLKYHQDLEGRRSLFSEQGLMAKTSSCRELLFTCSELLQTREGVTVLEGKERAEIESSMDDLMSTVSDMKAKLQEAQTQIRKAVLDQSRDLKQIMSNRDLHRSDYCRAMRQKMMSVLKTVKADDSRRDMSQGASELETLVRHLRATRDSISEGVKGARASMAGIKAGEKLQGSMRSARQSEVTTCRKLSLAQDIEQINDLVARWYEEISRLSNVGSETEEASREMLDRAQDFLLGVRDSHKSSIKTSNFLEAAHAYGMALEEERRLQRVNHLQHFPFHAIMSVAERIVDALDEDLALLETASEIFIEVYREHVNEVECVDSSGRLWKEKEKALKELSDAKQMCEDSKIRVEEIKIEEKKARNRGGDVSEARRKLEVTKKEYQRSIDHVWDKTKGLAIVASNYPEVMQEVHFLLHPDLLPLWSPTRDISCYFDEHTRLKTNATHTVWKCKKESEWFAVKMFHLPDHIKTLKRCMREAALLCRLKHPAVVEIVAIFEDVEKESFCIQMPFYAHGQLDEWVQESLPRWYEVRKVLYEVSEALSFLHENLVVHGDVKPANILIGSDFRGRLVDYDISVDLSQRTRSLYDTEMRSVAMTVGFEAPELMQTGCTYATDVWSFGATVAYDVVRASCFKEGAADSTVNNFISSLMVRDPTKRVKASMIKRDLFFAEIFNFDPRAKVRDCCIMGSEKCRGTCRTEDGILCMEDHFTCQHCLASYVEGQVREEMRIIVARGGHIKCPHFRCPHPLDEANLAQILPRQLFDMHLKTILKVAEQNLTMELETQMQARLEAEIESLKRIKKLEEKVREAEKTIEELLVTRCPRCHVAFHDFDGCFAVTCSRCACGFCAWCFADCGQDAHQHVSTCRLKLGSDMYFASREDFDKSKHRAARARLVDYLKSVEDKELIRKLRETETWGNLMQEFGISEAEWER